jgi:hypothetical protein
VVSDVDWLLHVLAEVWWRLKPVRKKGIPCLHGSAHLAPKGLTTTNPTFDVTPHKYITAIITEKGTARKPYLRGLKKFIGRQSNWTIGLTIRRSKLIVKQIKA